jgi:hypothetical protein
VIFWGGCEGEAIDRSRRPSGFAPAFGRAVGPSAWLVFDMVEAVPFYH